MADMGMRTAVVGVVVLGFACAPRDTTDGSGGGGGGGTTRSLSVHLAGNGSGEVRSTAPVFTCTASCTQPVAGSVPVQLVTTAASGSTFAGWSGACSGIASCNVTM